MCTVALARLVWQKILTVRVSNGEPFFLAGLL